ncbi:MAG: methylenetetrahydrofolate reductase [Candidatus Omnitrophota bacterium]
MNFCEKLQTGKFIVTTEIGPPKGIETGYLLEEVALIRGRVDAISVTDLQSSVMRLGALAVCILLKQNHLEPIYQLTCRDRNRLALQSDLLSAAVFGIENLLIATGDHPAIGDHPDAKPVFDLDSVQLLEAIKGLQKGTDMKGNQLVGKAPCFCPGAVVNPNTQPLEPEIIKMEKKISAGAQFFMTQAVYNVNIFEKFLRKTRHLKIPIFAGIVMLKSSAMASYMNENVPGIFVPDSLIKEMQDAQDKQKQSIVIASRLIKEFKSMCQGVHVMPIGWNRFLPQVLDASGL